MPFWAPARRKLLLVVLACKVGCVILALCATKLFPSFNQHEYLNDIHWPLDGPPTLATHFATWDGAHYLFLSEVGYSRGSSSCAFYPLWPLMIRACSYLTLHNYFVAGLLLANLLSLATFLLFHYFVERYHSLETANVSLALLLAYPGALYFSFIYTESLFFFLVILFFLFLFQERYWCAAIVGFLLPLTKAVGFFCLFPLLYHLFLRKKLWPAILAAYYGPVLGYFAYFIFMYCATGNAFEGFQAQRFYPNQPSVSHIVDLPRFLDHLFMPLQLHGMLDSAIDRGLFLLLLGSLYWIFKLNRLYFVYACFVGLIPAASSWFLSYSRNVMMCFPLFILYGELLKGEDRRFTLWYAVLVMATIQVWFLLRHINFIWVT